MIGCSCFLYAYVLNGSDKQFDVVYDTEKSAIVMQLGTSYLGRKSSYDENNIKDIKIEEKQVTLYLQDKYHQLLGYIINGNTYVKIRDVVKLLGIEIGCADETKEITIVVQEESGK